MKNKIIKILIIVFILIILLMFLLGIFPKQIAKIYASNYMNENFPQMQLKYIGIEYSKTYGDYLISFRDNENQYYRCIISPKYFPVSLGQGLFEIEQNYIEKYLEPQTIEQKVATLTCNFSYSLEDQTKYSDSYLTTHSNLIDNYRVILKSDSVKNEVKKTYSNVGDIEVETEENSNSMTLIYVCDKNSEEDCIKIINKYFEVFKNKITSIYKVNDVFTIDGAYITTRTVKK